MLKLGIEMTLGYPRTRSDLEWFWDWNDKIRVPTLWVPSIYCLKFFLTKHPQTSSFAPFSAHWYLGCRYFPVTGPPQSSTKLYCLVKKSHVCTTCPLITWKWTAWSWTLTASYDDECIQPLTAVLLHLQVIGKMNTARVTRHQLCFFKMQSVMSLLPQHNTKHKNSRQIRNKLFTQHLTNSSDITMHIRMLLLATRFYR